MEGLRKVLEANAKSENLIITSSLILAEFRLSGFSNKAVVKLNRALLRSDIIAANVDLRIAELAGEIKSHYSHDPRTMSLGDAIHAATAIVYGVTELHTFDDKGTKLSIGLIEISGNVAGKYNLKITKPFEKQAALALETPDTK